MKWALRAGSIIYDKRRIADMRIENALNEPLHQLTGIGAENDSTLRFITDNPSAFMVIQKIK